MYNIVVFQRTRGQYNAKPYVVKQVSRVKEARGECKAQRNSLFNLLLEKYEVSSYSFCYHEWRDYYVYLIEDAEGIYVEAHVYIEPTDD